MRVNSEISERMQQVYVIDEKGAQLGVMTAGSALDEAEKRGLDLVEVMEATGTNLASCKFMNYDKIQYQKSKASKGQGKQKKQKQIRLSPGIQDADRMVKLAAIKRLLAKGHSVQISMVFKGRQITHSELGMDVLKSIAGDLSEIAVMEQIPTPEGKAIHMVVKSK